MYVTLDLTSFIAGKLSSVNTYRQCAELKNLKSKHAYYRLFRNIPAAVTVAMGSWSRAARNDIKKGTRFIWFIAFSALLEVSLKIIRIG